MKNEHFWELPVEDQNQYFGKTFFRVQVDKENAPLWLYCLGFLGANQAKGNIQGVPGIELVDLTVWKPIFDFPESGLYNFGHSSLYFQKIPARQVKKGVSSETSIFDNFKSLLKLPVKESIMIKESKPIKIWSIEGISEIFGNSHEYSLADAFTFISKRKQISFAINRKFALGLGITSNHYNLWYKRILVGEVPSPKKVLLFPTMFEQEVFDQFHEEASVHRINLR